MKIADIEIDYLVDPEIESPLASYSEIEANCLNKKLATQIVGRSASGGKRAWPELISVINRILASKGIHKDFLLNAEEPSIKEIPLEQNDLDDGVLEGNQRFRQHLSRERSATIVTNKKDEVFNQKGKLECEVCSFNFADFYGEERGGGFIECHHKKPLSVADRGKTKLSDLALVCANCHRILHRRMLMSVEDLRAHLERIADRRR